MQVNMADFKPSPASIVMAVGGVLLLLGSLLGWASVNGFGRSQGVPGEALGVTPLIPMLVGLVAIVAGVAFAYKKEPFSMAWIGAAVAGAIGVLVLLLIIINLLRVMGEVNAVNNIDILGTPVSTGVSVSPGLGLIVLLAGVVATIAGAALGFMETSKSRRPQTAYAAPTGGYMGGPPSPPSPSMSPSPPPPPPAAPPSA